MLIEKESSFFYVAFEGPDGSGKTTIASEVTKMLLHVLQQLFSGKDVYVFDTKQPSKYAISELNALGSNPKDWLRRMFIFMEDHRSSARRIDNMLEIMTPDEITVVIQDRSYHSSCVYQSIESDGKVTPTDIHRAYFAKNSRPICYKPDLTLVLSADIGNLMGRLSARSAHEDFEDEQEGKIIEVSQLYEEILQDKEFDECRRVDASGDIDHVVALCIEQIAKGFEEKRKRLLIRSPA